MKKLKGNVTTGDNLRLFSENEGFLERGEEGKKMSQENAWSRQTGSPQLKILFAGRQKERRARKCSVLDTEKPKRGRATRRRRSTPSEFAEATDSKKKAE